MESIWIGIALDPIQQILHLLTMSSSKEEAEEISRMILDEELEARDLYYWSVFDFTKMDELNKLVDWLREGKVPEREIPDVMEKLREQFQSLTEGSDDGENILEAGTDIHRAP